MSWLSSIRSLRWLLPPALLLVTLARPAAAQMFDDFVLPTGTTAAPAGAPPWVIADFDDGRPALKDGTPFTPSGSGKVAIQSEEKIRHQGKGRSLRVSYEMGEKGVAGIAVDLKGLDASKRRAITFFTFGGREGTPGEIEVTLRAKDFAGKTRIKGISPYFWGRQVIPFTKLGIADTSKLTALEITVPEGGRPAKGTFYIDRVAFE